MEPERIPEQLMDYAQRGTTSNRMAYLTDKRNGPKGPNIDVEDFDLKLNLRRL
jgi:hypothetical protein